MEIGFSKATNTNLKGGSVVCGLDAIEKESLKLLERKNHLVQQRREMLEFSHDPDPSACISCSEIDAQINDIEMRLAELDDAKKSLKQGRGENTCEDCKKPIPQERREARPTTTRCVECQARFEKKRKPAPPFRNEPPSDTRRQRYGDPKAYCTTLA